MHMTGVPTRSFLCFCSVKVKQAMVLTDHSALPKSVHSLSTSHLSTSLNNFEFINYNKAKYEHNEL